MSEITLTMTSFEHCHLGSGIITIATEPLSFSSYKTLTDGRD